MNSITGSTNAFFNYVSAQSAPKTPASDESDVRGMAEAEAISQSGTADTGLTERAGADALLSKLDGLISSGILTEDEKQDLLGALRGTRALTPPPVPAEISESLDSLVSAGTISDGQADAVMSALENFSGADPLQELTEAGALTQQQADAVSSAFQSAAKMKHAQEAYGAVMSGWTKRE
jgi:hypothetical protein